MYHPNHRFDAWRQGILVASLEAKRPLVTTGGHRELTEEFFDAGRQTDNRAGVFLSFYDTMLAGGEPYSIWL